MQYLARHCDKNVCTEIRIKLKGKGRPETLFAYTFDTLFALRFQIRMMRNEEVETCSKMTSKVLRTLVANRGEGLRKISNFVYE